MDEQCWNDNYVWEGHLGNKISNASSLYKMYLVFHNCISMKGTNILSYIYCYKLGQPYLSNECSRSIFSTGVTLPSTQLLSFSSSSCHLTSTRSFWSWGWILLSPAVRTVTTVKHWTVPAGAYLKTMSTSLPATSATRPTAFSARWASNPSCERALVYFHDYIL